MLGVVLRLAEGHTYGSEAPFLGFVEDHGNLVLLAVRTPPHNLLVWTGAEGGGALDVVVEHFVRRRILLPGVHGRTESAGPFARIWSARTGMSARTTMQQRLYRLTAVRSIPGVPGAARLATLGDLPRLEAWARSFVAEAASDAAFSDVRLVVERMIECRDLLVWDDHGPASMAAAVRPTPRGCSIGFVYTPPDRRARGYATACVAALSRRILKSGKTFCTLFTDMANPTSNAIYQRIGYEALGDFLEVRFITPSNMA